jgi:hypothetical protein
MEVVNGQAVDIDAVLRPPVKPAFCGAPVIFGQPVAAQSLKFAKRHSL